MKRKLADKESLGTEGKKSLKDLGIVTRDLIKDSRNVADTKDSIISKNIDKLLQKIEITPEDSEIKDPFKGTTTPLIFAVICRKAEIVCYFLDELKLDVNQCDESGNTALMAAIGSKQKFDRDIVKLLIERGAKVNVFNNLGKGAFNFLPNSKTRSKNSLTYKLLVTTLEKEKKEEREIHDASNILICLKSHTEETTFVDDESRNVAAEALADLNNPELLLRKGIEDAIKKCFPNEKHSGEEFKELVKKEVLEMEEIVKRSSYDLNCNQDDLNCDQESIKFVIKTTFEIAGINEDSANSLEEAPNNEKSNAAFESQTPASNSDNNSNNQNSAFITTSKRPLPTDSSKHDSRTPTTTPLVQNKKPKHAKLDQKSNIKLT